MIRLTDDELIELFDKQLPDLLERRPELEPRIYHAFMKFFATKEEVAVVLAELRDFRAEFDGFRDEVQERFTNLEERMEAGFQRLSLQDQRLEERMEAGFQRLSLQDQRLEERMEAGFQRLSLQDQRLEERMEAGFRDMQHTIDRLGSRWGIRNESIFRQAIAELLEKSFGFHVEERTIQGEQFDCVISDGQHILVEISASVGPNIQDKLERKRRLYTEATGVVPARVILVTAFIHSRRAQALREAGFEVIEPEEDTLDR
ncbi:DUF3782 domain-containing protein [Candidatus Poribacteria bacterium]|nr:DUF3782 domain-containing protein [Candidatus Poribacteria bacterium]